MLLFHVVAELVAEQLQGPVTVVLFPTLDTFQLCLGTVEDRGLALLQASRRDDGGKRSRIWVS